MKYIVRQVILVTFLFSTLGLESLAGDHAKNVAAGYNVGRVAETNLGPRNKNQMRQWFVRRHNTVYSIIRFFLTGTTVGMTLIYALGVPPVKAITVGALSGAMSGLVQYNIDAIRDWLEDNQLAIDADALINHTKTYHLRSKKTVLIEVLTTSERITKFASTEIGHHSISRIAMLLLRVPGVLPGFSANLANILKTSTQATIAGVAPFGLFTDLKMQQKYNGWSDDVRELVQNTTTFLLSAAAAAFSALQLVNPKLSRTIDLGVIDMPVGFASIALVGIGFYGHALVTYWVANR